MASDIPCPSWGPVKAILAISEDRLFARVINWGWEFWGVGVGVVA